MSDAAKPPEVKPIAPGAATGPSASSATASSNGAAPVVAGAAIAPAHEPARVGATAAPSTNEAVPATALAPTWQPPKPLADDAALALIGARFAIERDPRDRWGLTAIVAADQLRAVVGFLRADPVLRVDMLLDVVAVDYLSYPDHRAARFAVIYAFKSLATNQRLKLKVWVDEESPRVPSIADQFKIADWMEREAWDQIGVVFDGHPNLKRLLNHHEFIGHPLRKDYPCQKRQKLSVNDPMLDELSARLIQRGYTILDPGVIDARETMATPHADPATGGARQNDPDLASAANGQSFAAKRGVL